MFKMSNKTDEDILNELNSKNAKRFGLTIAYCIVVITFGILGNIFSLVFYRFKARKTTTTMLLTWLTAIDMCVCIWSIDLIIKLFFSINYPYKYVCKFTYVVIHFLCISSVCLLVTIGVDRFRKTCRPLNWQFTVKTTKVSIGVIIASVFILSSRYSVTVDIDSMVTDPDSGRRIEARHCTHTKDPKFESVVFAFHLIDALLLAVAFISLIVIYTIIAMNLWRHRKVKLRNNRNELRYSKSRKPETEQETNPESTDKTDELERVNEPKLSNRMTMSDMAKQEATTEDLPVGTNHDRTVDINTSPKDACHKHSVSDVNGDLHISPLAMEKSCNRPDKKITDWSSYAERKVTIMMLVISLAFIFSYLPYLLSMLNVNQSSELAEHDLDAGGQIAVRSFLLNNAINPYIQVIFHLEFRRFVKKVFSTLFCVSG